MTAHLISDPSPLIPETRAAVMAERVTLALGARTVLSEVSFAIEPGELIGVLGPNGAGKTTLMRALLGLVPVRSGNLYLHGAAVGSRIARQRQSIGYLPQQRSALTQLRLRGRDFVACAASGQRWGWPWLDRRARAAVERALEQVNARALATRPLADLSGGERQRLLLAQCLLDEPRLLLLDEPLINLDPSHQRKVVELVRQIQRERQITVLFSSHELNPLLHALDRVLYLGAGHAAIGPVEDVITPAVLSRLYGSPIDVIRANGRIFVMSGGLPIEHDNCHEAHDA